MTRSDARALAQTLLPLDAKAYHLLFTLRREPMHGYGLCKELERRTDGLIRLAPGNLYRVIRRLMRDGLVEDAPETEAAADEDERRKYYRLTPLGMAVLGLETERMRGLVEEADRERLSHALRGLA